MLFCKSLWDKKDYYQKLYDVGSEKMEKELDIVRLIKQIRYMKILMKHSLMSSRVRYELTHSDKNLINVDTSEDEEETKDSSNGGTKKIEEDPAEENPTLDPNQILQNLTRGMFSKKNRKTLADIISFTRKKRVFKSKDEAG